MNSAARNQVMTGLIVALWLTLLCIILCSQVRAARQQAHTDLTHAFAAGKLDAARVIEVFDGANRELTTAALAPCLILSTTVLLLLSHLLKLKRKYNEAEHDLQALRAATWETDHARPD